MKKAKIVGTYLLSFFIVLLVGGLAASLTTSKSQYEALIQPPLAPPSYLFGIVWPFLYIFMAVGIAHIFVKFPKQRQKAFALYAIQIVLNYLWSFLFFFWEERLFALILIIILLVVVALMIREFRKLSPWMARLQIPYLAWLTFATYLNATMWFLNK